jgi:hypothetical protein
MVVRQRFTDGGSGTGVTSLVHISGPHANFVSSSDETAEAGFLGFYDNTLGLHVELPRILAGNVLDRDSVRLSVRNALLRYFSTNAAAGMTVNGMTGDVILNAGNVGYDGGSLADFLATGKGSAGGSAGISEIASDGAFLLAQGSKNVITCSQALQDLGFSFRANGVFPRAAVFFDRDVQIGDTVHVTANVGGEVKDLWTSVAGIKPRYLPGTVDAAVVLGDRNAADQTASLVLADQSASAVTVTLGSAANWYAPMLQRGVAKESYQIDTVFGGDALTARFRVSSSTGTTANSAAAAEDPVTHQIRLPIGDLDAWLVLDNADTFTPGMSWTVTAQALLTAAAAAGSGSYTGGQTALQPKQITYIVTVTKGGEIPASAPSTDAEIYAAPTLSVQTANGSDKSQLVRVLQQGIPVLLSRYGVQIAFTGNYLVTGDKYYITCHSSYADIYPTLILNRNVPDDWTDPAADVPVTLELFLREEETVLPEYSLTLAGPASNYEVDSEGVRINPNALVTAPSWTVAGEPGPLTLYGSEEQGSGKVYMSMRYFVPDLAKQVVRVSTIDELNELVSGPVVRDNPLKYAAFYALNEGAGAAVLLTAVTDPNDLTEWQNVIDLVSDRNDVFHLLPLCEGNHDVHELFYQHILSSNQPETARERMLFLISYDEQTKAVLTERNGFAVTGKMSIETSVGSSQYAAWTAETDGADFTEAGVKAGDTLRTYFDFDSSGKQVWTEYRISEVVNSSVLRLDVRVEKVVPDQAGMAFEIWRTQSNTDYADSIAATDGFSNMAVVYIRSNNTNPYYGPVAPAAALVGLIGSVVSHQGVTWYPLTGINPDLWENSFSESQLNHLAGNGVLVISRHSDGYVCARHAVTTYKSPEAGVSRTRLTVKMTEEMYIRNAFLVLKEYRNSLRGFVGVTNVSEGTKLAIRANIDGVSQALYNASDYPQLGGRITTLPENIVIQESGLLADRLYVNFTTEGPFPLNVLDVTMYF